MTLEESTMKTRKNSRGKIRQTSVSKKQTRAGKQYETLLYDVRDGIATVTLNRPDRLNTIVPPMPDEIEDAVGCAVSDREAGVIVLRGAGRAFSAGFDFGGGFHQWEDLLNTDGKWDPGKDFIGAAAAFGLGAVPKFMSIWRSPKPVIAQVHGWCVGGGSDLALCADLVIASSDARIGTPYSRIWGCSLTGMWVYRLGLAKAKEFALTGKPLSGVEAAQAGLINRAVPFRRLEGEVRRAAGELASIPLSQLAAMKLIVNQAYDNMGLASTQTLGPILDGLMRNTPDALRFIEKANREGVSAAVASRDGLFRDYSQGRQDERPNPRNIIRPR
jgi:enoyl-CoA hydratase